MPVTVYPAKSVDVTGGYVNFYRWTATADTTTSSSYEDIAGSANVSLTFPVTRDYLVLGIINSMFVATSSAVVNFGVVIDDGTPVDFVPFTFNTINHRMSWSASFTTPITQGAHNFRIQWKRNSGTGTPTFNAGVTETLLLMFL